MPQQEQLDLNSFLTKIASFVKLAVDVVDDLDHNIASMKRKEASELCKQAKYSMSLKEAAEALYESDFITDETERKQFLKKANEDPSYLASTIVKVCQAADVAQIGSPARVTANVSRDYDDPVEREAFGLKYSGHALDLD